MCPGAVDRHAIPPPGGVAILEPRGLAQFVHDEPNPAEKRDEDREAD